MKTLIDNRTELSNESIGILLDNIQKREKNTTQYYGKWKGYMLEIDGVKLHIETLVMKKYFKVLIMEE